MNYRFMRVLVFFDLPMQTAYEKKQYSDFRKHLIKSGFIQMQKSVYSKLTTNKTVSNTIKKNIKKYLPKDGVVQVLEITENQFSKIEYFLGYSSSKILDNDKRLVIYD
jgi:CRISPR-associated protein Cas2